MNATRKKRKNERYAEKKEHQRAERNLIFL